MLARYLPAVAAMVFVVALSNYLVQFPVQFQLGNIQLADLLTWGAFSYPLAFLVSDLTNRRHGPAGARVVALSGFAIAVLFSIWLATPRIAMASGSAFLLAQFLDITIFDFLRRATWWRAPLVSSLIGSVLDTLVFFSLAFAAPFAFLGSVDTFVGESTPLLGVLDVQVARWVSWALGDFSVKILVALVMLVPYGVLRRFLVPPESLVVSPDNI
ncbi:MAG TPA: VUT family protein [Devosia sp.]|nr:VUT family protein [Devosia sp.]